MNRRKQLNNTYSIVAHDPATGEIGGAVQTHQMGVGSVVLWMEPGLGAVATQSLTNISFGPLALSLLREGVAPQRVIAALTASDEGAKWRQVGVVDAQGRAAAWTGASSIREAAHQTGEHFSVQANMMTNPTVVNAMAAAFTAASGDLAGRMLAALEAAQAEGGDIRGMQSAALKVVSGDRSAPAWKTLYDLRVDEHEDPVTELGRLVRLRHAQNLDDAGHKALEGGERDRALDLWAQARAEAPELEELPFWQGVTLADTGDDLAAGVELLQGMLAAEPRRVHWLDLIGRLQECGLIEREGVAAALLDALQ